MEKAPFGKKKLVFASKIALDLRKQFVMCYISEIA
jgi:hypothetical protein